MRMGACLLVGLVSLAASEDALAQDDMGGSSVSSDNRLGVGAETLLTTPFGPTGGAAFVYDAGLFRISALVYLLAVENSMDAFGIGARFFYVLHEGKAADFSVGAGIAVTHADPDPGRDQTRAHVEGAAQLRAFITPSVALNATVGLGLAFGEGAFQVSLGGQLTAGFGATYYF